MKKSAGSRFATARERLRKIEEAIRPYVQDLTPKGKPRREEWIPGDFIDWRKSGAQVTKTKASEIT
jgi:hypothetical protein